jgi:signal transduction histidine kinase
MSFNVPPPSLSQAPVLAQSGPVLPLLQMPLAEALSALHTTAAAVVEPLTGTLLWCNLTFTDWFRQADQENDEPGGQPYPPTDTAPSRAGAIDPSMLPKQIITHCWRLPPKTTQPLPLDPDRVGLPIAPHIVLQHPCLETAETFKFKVKYHWFGDQLLVLINPFAEDVTLTAMHADFVSTISHEFRTPLTSIKGFADTLLRYGDKVPPDQGRRFITIIKDQADRLTRLVENLLAVSKLGTSNAEQLDVLLRPVPLPPVVERIIQTLKAKGAGSRHFDVRFAPKLEALWVDPDRLEQILLNLIDNAVKYSPDHTTIWIEARPCPQQSDQALITIRDEGVGIDAQHLPTIFTKFSRIDHPLTRTVEGTGLGLYITKSLTLALGGTIEAQSNTTPPLPTGTTFTVSLPVATPQRQAAYRRQILVEGGESG